MLSKFLYFIIWLIWVRVQIETSNLEAFIFSTLMCTLLSIMVHLASED